MNIILEEQIYLFVLLSNGITALELSELLEIDRTEINRILYKNEGKVYRKNDFYKWSAIKNKQLNDHINNEIIDSFSILNSLFQFVFFAVRYNKSIFLKSRSQVQNFNDIYSIFEHLSISLIQLFIYIKIDTTQIDKISLSGILKRIKHKYKQEFFVEILPDEFEFCIPENSREILDSSLFIKILRVLTNFDIEEQSYNVNIFLSLIDNLVISFMNEEGINNEFFTDKEYLNLLYNEVSNLKSKYSTCSVCNITDFTFRMDYRISKVFNNETWLLCNKCLSNYDYDHNINLLKAILSKNEIVE